MRRWVFVYWQWASSSISCVIGQGEFLWPRHQKKESYFCSLSLPVVTETQLEAGLHHCTRLFGRLKAGQLQLPTIAHLVRMKMRFKFDKRASRRELTKSQLWSRKKGANKGLWLLFRILFDRLTGSTDPLCNVDSFILTEHIGHVTSSEAPDRHSSGELNCIMLFSKLIWLLMPTSNGKVQRHINTQLQQYLQTLILYSCHNWV